MSSRNRYAAALAFLLVGAALAQDPTKVEPKHYRLMFENERVQVVSVHYGPHEKSEMHEHPGGVVVIVTGGHLRFTDQNGKITDVLAKAGEARWFPPFKHKVENVGNEPYNAVYVGMRNMKEARNIPEGGLPASPNELARLLADVPVARP